MKRKLKFENHENCLKATRLENKRNHLEKIKLAQIYLKSQKEFTKNKKLILQRQHRFKNERHNVFPEVPMMIK